MFYGNSELSSQALSVSSTEEFFLKSGTASGTSLTGCPTLLLTAMFSLKPAASSRLKSPTLRRALESIIQLAIDLLSRLIDTTVAAAVRRSLNFKICTCVITVFALVSCGTGRSNFTIKCVFENCPAFLDNRTLDCGDGIKWQMVGISHSHDFVVFPSRVPRNIIPDSVRDEVERMMTEKHPRSQIRVQHNLLCNNDVFQNIVREAHKRMNSDHDRALRDAAAMSIVWSSTVHLTDTNMFLEVFFVNAVLIAKRVDAGIAYIDGTACVNAFMLPVGVMLVQDAVNNTHALG